MSNPKQSKTKQKPKKQKHHQQERMGHAGTLKTIKRPNRWIIVVEEKNIQLRGTENTFKNNRRKIF